MNNKILRTYANCGHTVTTTAYYRHSAGSFKEAGACPTCCALAVFLVKHGLDDAPAKIKALSDYAYATPSGSARHIKATLEHVAVLYPTDLPLIITSKGKHEDLEWAERALAGTAKPKRVERQSTQVAKIVKKGLLKMFPGHKVSVNSDHNAVHARVAGITWEEGRRAEGEFGQYRSGRYDGMNDIYDYSNYNKDIPQVMFLSIGSDY